MSNGTPCSSQLIWCETKVEKLERELAEKIDRNGVLYIRLAEGQAREKVLHGLSNELLHQIDINDFKDSHGHSAKMLNAVHDLMKYNTQPTDDTALKTAIQHGITEFLERTGQYVTNDASRKAALKAERERCIYACMQGDYEYKTAQECVEDIGALGDE